MRVVPPKGAPNVLLIMTDDTGFGVTSTFGGVTPTPSLDRIAKNGLRYTNFNSTALCSPTRAALITGRNHHSMGFGVVAEQSTGYPGYNSIMTPDKATIGKMLKDYGYRTSWFGKDHNTPEFQASQAGPFDQWPTGMGFDYFYGFVGGDANQWQPNLFRNTTAIYPYNNQPGWNLVTAMADDAIEYMRRITASTRTSRFSSTMCQAPSTRLMRTGYTTSPTIGHSTTMSLTSTRTNSRSCGTCSGLRPTNIKSCHLTPRWQPGSLRRVPVSPPAAQSSLGPARSPEHPMETRQASSTLPTTSKPKSRSAGRRRRHDCHPGRPIRRLRVLLVEEQARVPVQPGGSESGSLGWSGCTAAGQAHYRVQLRYDGLGLGTLAFNNVSGISRGGTRVLKVDGKEVARPNMEHSIPLIMQWDENFDIGADTGTPVNDKDYQVPFRFTASSTN
jgi:hypothetical protein